MLKILKFCVQQQQKGKGDANDGSLNFTLMPCCAGATVTMVTAEDADVGENSRLSYSIAAGDETGVFTMDDNSGLITWSDVANHSLADCSWSLTVKVTDHGSVKQLWTLASLIIVIDDCVVDNTVHTSSRQSAGDPGRLAISDWHVFVVAVAIAACVVVVGSFVTVVVALRYCGRRRRQKTTTTTFRDDRLSPEGELMLKLVPSPTQSSNVSSDSMVSTMASGTSDHVQSAVSSCTDHVVLVVDQLHSHDMHSQTLIRALQQAHHQIHGPLQVNTTATTTIKTTTTTTTTTIGLTIVIIICIILFRYKVLTSKELAAQVKSYYYGLRPLTHAPETGSRNRCHA